MSKSMLKIGMLKSSLSFNLLRHVHKPAMETHGTSDVRKCNSQVYKLPHKSAIGMHIYK